MAAKKSTKATSGSKSAASRRTVEDRIDDLKNKIRLLEERRAAKELAREPLFKHLRATRTALTKATELMDGRKGKLSAEFIRASKQYLNLLGRALDEVAGRKRRGRKPKADLGD